MWLYSGVQSIHDTQDAVALFGLRLSCVGCMTSADHALGRGGDRHGIREERDETHHRIRFRVFPGVGRLRLPSHKSARGVGAHTIIDNSSKGQIL